jgi:hypothetical protein
LNMKVVRRRQYLHLLCSAISRFQRMAVVLSCACEDCTLAPALHCCGRAVVIVFGPRFQMPEVEGIVFSSVYVCGYCSEMAGEVTFLVMSAQGVYKELSHGDCNNCHKFGL